jgi:hypothetical protein
LVLFLVLFFVLFFVLLGVCGAPPHRYREGAGSRVVKGARRDTAFSAPSGGALGLSLS